MVNFEKYDDIIRHFVHSISQNFKECLDGCIKYKHVRFDCNPIGFDIKCCNHGYVDGYHFIKSKEEWDSKILCGDPIGAYTFVEYNFKCDDFDIIVLYKTDCRVPVTFIPINVTYNTNYLTTDYGIDCVVGDNMEAFEDFLIQYKLMRM